MRIELAAERQLQYFKHILLKENVKLCCYVQSNKSINSKSSALFTCKISRSGNCPNKSFKNFSKLTQNGKLLLCMSMTFWCANDALLRLLDCYTGIQDCAGHHLWN